MKIIVMPRLSRGAAAAPATQPQLTAPTPQPAAPGRGRWLVLYCVHCLVSCTAPGTAASMLHRRTLRGETLDVQERPGVGAVSPSSPTDHALDEVAPSATQDIWKEKENAADVESVISRQGEQRQGQERVQEHFIFRPKKMTVLELMKRRKREQAIPHHPSHKKGEEPPESDATAQNSLQRKLHKLKTSKQKHRHKHKHHQFVGTYHVLLAFGIGLLCVAAVGVLVALCCCDVCGVLPFSCGPGARREKKLAEDGDKRRTTLLRMAHAHGSAEFATSDGSSDGRARVGGKKGKQGAAKSKAKQGTSKKAVAAAGAGRSRPFIGYGLDKKKKGGGVFLPEKAVAFPADAEYPQYDRKTRDFRFEDDVDSPDRKSSGGGRRASRVSLSVAEVLVSAASPHRTSVGQASKGSRASVVGRSTATEADPDVSGEFYSAPTDVQGVLDRTDDNPAARPSQVQLMKQPALAKKKPAGVKSGAKKKRIESTFLNVVTEGPPTSRSRSSSIVSRGSVRSSSMSSLNSRGSKAPKKKAKAASKKR